MSRSGVLILVETFQEIIIYIINYKKLVNQNIFKNEGRRAETVCALEHHHHHHHHHTM